jgi:UDP-3-O-[3-hydroxymyristoyl] glucosamine N-acyltransferase
MKIEHKTHYTLKELIQSFSEELSKELDIKIKGNPESIVKGVCTIQDAQADHITFLTNPLYKKYLSTTKASVVILSQQDADDCPVNAIITRNPYYAYAKIAALFNPRSKPISGIHPSAVIEEGCEIHQTASIGPNSVIGKGVKIAAHAVIGPGCSIGEYSEIGEESHLDANVTLYDRIILGKKVQIMSGAVIGGDGFGIAKHKGAWLKVPQLGRVIIGDDVEIGANTTIDRGAIEDTIIEKGVKLDNLIQVGHNVRIGENTAVAGCVGISGSAVIGKNCIIGGASNFAGHITVADNTVITGGTEVSKSIKEPGMYSSGIGGLVTNLEWRKNSARVLRLEQLIQRVKELESALQKLTERDVP